MKYLLAIAILLSSTAQAIDADKFEHFGGGYICQDLSSKLSVAVLRLDKVDAKIFGGFGCVFLGLIKESTDRHYDAGDLGAQFAGQFLQITFDF